MQTEFIKTDRKNLLLDFLLILLTGGIWNIWMQYRQIRDFNLLLSSNEYSFMKWVLLSLITLGIYHIYHEYKLTRHIYEFSTHSKDGFEVGLIAGIVSATGAWIFVDLYQQSILNELKVPVSNQIG